MYVSLPLSAVVEVVVYDLTLDLELPRDEKPPPRRREVDEFR